MVDWVTNLFSALGGAIIALVGRELIDWFKRPRLTIDFESIRDEKPYPIQQDLETKRSDIATGLNLIRFEIRNKGQRAALNCNVKLETFNEKYLYYSSNDLLPYSLRDNLEYPETVDELLRKYEENQAFNPVTINRGEKINVDFCYLITWFYSNEKFDYKVHAKDFIQQTTKSKPIIVGGVKENFRVTVYSNNTKPKSLKFSVNWDGTSAGFSKAFSIVRKFKGVHH
jgi:hypothetical protein